MEEIAAARARARASNKQSRRTRSFNNKPSWLLCTIADLDERMKMLTWKDDNTCDSFAARANSYYHERPHLLALLQDLYNGYLSLADRYCQSLSKNTSPILFDHLDEVDTGEVIDSDAESSLSYQPLVIPHNIQAKGIDEEMMVADLVMKTVDYEIVLNELDAVEKRWGDSSRKSELQKNLLDVLESERLILLNDNATLGYRVNALMEENKGLVSESLFLKRKAGELARCVLMTREDHRVCMLSRKIEDLQGQIYGLEKRNKEYYEQLVEKGGENIIKFKGRKSIGGKQQVSLEDCFQVRGGGGGLSKCFSLNVKRNGDRNENREVEGGKATKLWDKVVKKFDLMFNCNPHSNSGSCCAERKNIV
ncbi:hypothetical protein ACJIZ3_010040 [Penstemon smallii]|uniref:NAB domain-containing protein n=1 Tax=Penstemon smallii TaxID=265156 RepID=A0ABD3TE72_9LAMI